MVKMAGYVHALDSSVGSFGRLFTLTLSLLINSKDERGSRKISVLLYVLSVTVKFVKCFITITCNYFCILIHTNMGFQMYFCSEFICFALFINIALLLSLWEVRKVLNEFQ